MPARRIGLIVALVLWSPAILSMATSSADGGAVLAQGQGAINPYRMVEDWAKLPNGRPMGAVGKVTIDVDGRHVWAVIRCERLEDEARFGDECRDSKADSVFRFSPDGKVVNSFGAGLFIWPHGIDVDPDGNVWVTDAVAPARTPSGTRGHQVIKFSPDGRVLMTLGTRGMAGAGPTHLNAPSDVVVAASGEIFVADGHNENGNNQVVKFSKDGARIKTWGRTGYAPSEFRGLHAIAIDSRGRVFVGDRGNNRIQIFDQNGQFLAQWTQFGKPSGIFFDDNDRIYVADSESDNVQNPGWEMGIRIGDARTGWVDTFVPFPWADPRVTRGTGAEFVAVDREGNMYGGEPVPKVLRKYVRVRP